MMSGWVIQLASQEALSKYIFENLLILFIHSKNILLDILLNCDSIDIGP